MLVYIAYDLNMELCKCSHSSRAFVGNMSSILSEVNPRVVKVKVKGTLEPTMEAQWGIEV